MNILPKKRWHVRTKENIARVRKDEAEAAEKEKQEQLRVENADREARLRVLKQKSKEKLQQSHTFITDLSPSEQQEHINLFTDFENAVQTTNKEHDKEIKEKKEEYEKKIGYLTYLGQDTNEALRKKNWYEVLPESSRCTRSSDIKETYDKLVLKDAEGRAKISEPDVKYGEIDYKLKQRHDPIKLFEKYCFTAKNKNTKMCNKNRKDESNRKKHSYPKDQNEKQLKLQKLREARLKREQQEKSRTEAFLAGLSGDTNKKVEKCAPPTIKPKYNSQFNPELARQNYY